MRECNMDVCMYPAFLAYYRALVLRSTIRSQVQRRQHALIDLCTVLMFAAADDRLFLWPISYLPAEVEEVVEFIFAFRWVEEEEVLK